MVESKEQDQQVQQVQQEELIVHGERDIEIHHGEDHYEDYEDFMSFMAEEWNIEEEDVYTYDKYENEFNEHDTKMIRLGMLLGQLDTHRFVGEPEENLFDLQYLIHEQLDSIFNN